MKATKRPRDLALPAAALAAPLAGQQPPPSSLRRARRAKPTRASLLLSHDTREKRSELKLKLHRTRLERSVAALRLRLQQWDAAEEEAAAAARRAEERRREEESLKAPEADGVEHKRKRGRLGPETWKLRGAARPASQVYDFDVRYVDPHIKAHEEAQLKAKRTVNLLLQAKKQSENGSSDWSFLKQAGDTGREFLAHLMQLAHVSQEMKHFKTARACFLECLELDSECITTAREDLMRMYMNLGRLESALRLGERLEQDNSVWVRYSHALASFESKQSDIESHMARAIQANPFCAYYLAFYDTFSSVMEYTDELEEAEEVPQSSLEEAIEYCAGKESKRWLVSKAVDDLRQLLLKAKNGKHDILKPADVEWLKRLEMIEAEYDSHRDASDSDEGSKTGADNDAEATSTEDQNELDESTRDLKMYLGMFKTAMEMLQDAGQLT